MTTNSVEGAEKSGGRGEQQDESAGPLVGKEGTVSK